ncbi:methyl-CpG-binding domain-containing protein 9-like [Impatiens glandulifera]|uniref:methyl-CpG-binding domain-containing protein 9-like n=1 Tax=Impatiens glandulifera TaxID=253017 RepID=UPI001FB15EB5|nr:methyl-CpG-binding domain-containing protein 9-like [Impatiens glandulifera]XP_047322175.1 methyl-CpG-binding domain-containing protein 9-like [Impatiens glandulifera]
MDNSDSGEMGSPQNSSPRLKNPFLIDLNQTPVSSPGESAVQDDAFDGFSGEVSAAFCGKAAENGAENVLLNGESILKRTAVPFNIHVLPPRDAAGQCSSAVGAAAVRAANNNKVNSICNTGSIGYCLNGSERTANFEYGLSTQNEHGIQPGSVRAESSFSPLFTSLKYPSLYRAEDGFPFQFKDFFVLATGNVDPRPSYHNCTQIWPIGYRSCWHDKFTGSIFNFEVCEGDDFGPIFNIQRYSCSKVPIPIGSTVLTRHKIEKLNGQSKVSQNELYSFETEDGESSSTKMVLSEQTSPSLEDMKDDLQPCESIGEFSAVGRLASRAWENAVKILLERCHIAYKQTKVVQFCCSHRHDVESSDGFDSFDSLSRFGSLSGLIEFPSVIRSESEFKASDAMLRNWLGKDRFGLDAEFVLEILEKLPGAHALSKYTHLNRRIQHMDSQTVRSGYLFSTRTYAELTKGVCERGQSPLLEEKRKEPFPLGQPLSSKLPTDRVGDFMEVWEFLCHFGVLLDLEEDLSFQKLEDELINPWTALKEHMGEPQKVYEDDLVTCTGNMLRKIHTSLLRIIMEDLLVKVARNVDPIFEAGGFKPKQGRKNDDDEYFDYSSEEEDPEPEQGMMDNHLFLKKIKFDLLQINEVTWPELTRRYILMKLLAKCKLDSRRVVTRESVKIFRGLQGDGGVLCASFTGVAGMEADAKFLVETTEGVLGSTKENDIVIPGYEEPASELASEWVRALEPVRKMATNVGARIRNQVKDSLEKNPPEWARKLLNESISKEVYKGNASGPTKKMVLQVLTVVHTRNESSEMPKCDIAASNLISRKCRNVLRRAICEDKKNLLCYLLGNALVNHNDYHSEGSLGYPGMVSRPLDFRTIDVRLANGAYNGSPNAFVEDVRNVWDNVRKAFAHESDKLSLVERLSRNFEEMYDREVLVLVRKVEELCQKSKSSSIDDILFHSTDTSLPKAPWDNGICKLCGVDKDDKNVLLCDICDSEYHTYCLTPPLAKIPEGKWFCPLCISMKAKSKSRGVKGASKKTVSEGHEGALKNAVSEDHGHEQTELEALKDLLTQLARSMDAVEYWEMSVDERISLLKVICNEALCTRLFHNHIDQCTMTSSDQQQELHAFGLNSSLKSSLLSTKAAASLEKKYGMHLNRCTCLEFACSMRPHCMSCHHTFSSMEEMARHSGTCTGKGMDKPNVKEPLIYTQYSLQDLTSKIPVADPALRLLTSTSEKKSIQLEGQLKMLSLAGCSSSKSARGKLVGKTSQILRQLKAMLLDIDAALPEEGRRPSMAALEKRFAWRDFVKSASTINEMVKATILLENMIGADYLNNNWWHWSSLSAAANTCTVSSLSLRICTLDAAIMYETPLPSPSSNGGENPPPKGKGRSSMQIDGSRPNAESRKRKDKF